MSQNRQPANTVGFKPTQKGGTFTVIGRAEAPVGLDLGTQDTYMSSHGFPNPVRKANPAEESEYLVEDHQRLYTTDGGRNILLGEDWEGDSGAAIKVAGLDEEVVASSATAGRATSARSVLRDAILADALKTTILRDTDIEGVGSGFSEESQGYRFAATFLTVDKPYHLEHDYGTGETTVTSLLPGDRAPLHGEKLAAALPSLGGDTRSSEHELRVKMETLGASMLNDPDMDVELKAAIETSINR